LWVLFYNYGRLLKAALEDEDEPRVLLIALRHLAEGREPAPGAQTMNEPGVADNAEGFLRHGFLRRNLAMEPKLVAGGDILRPQLYEVLCLRE
jgi:hypothetical protein